MVRHEVHVERGLLCLVGDLPDLRSVDVARILTNEVDDMSVRRERYVTCEME